MTKYTLEQLKEMTNEQLDETVGGLQWNQLKGDWKSIIFDDPENSRIVFDYHPTTNKEQAWDLMVILLKTGFLVEHDDGTFGVKRYDYSFLGSADNKDPLIAVTIASILYLQEIE